MKVAEIPHHFNANMTPRDFDELLLALRIYVRDYEATPEQEALLASMEEAAANREVGGYLKWEPPGWDEDSPEDPDGGALVGA